MALIYLFFALLALLVSPLSADQLSLTQWGYLNNNENSAIIKDSQAQDLLNVDVTAGGKSIRKRPGYGLYKALGTGQGMHGGYHFFDSTGNDVQIWKSSTSVYGIVADATPTQLVSSSTLNSTMDCADTQGSAYCVDSSRDFLIKTNGASLQSWSTSPLGTMVEFTPDRLVVAGVSGTPNTLYVSASNNYTNFTVGINNTDAFTEVIASPGSKITHERWACGKLLWWKDQSFGYAAFSNQYDSENKIVSDTIGTQDNTSAVDPSGAVWFRGQDGHVWKYDCSALTKETIQISPVVQTAGRRTSNSWTQSSQADFQTGVSTPSGRVSFTISPGDVIVSSFTTTEASSTAWTSGTTNNTNVWPSSITMSTNNTGTATNPSFETCVGGGCAATCGTATGWTASGAGRFSTCRAGSSVAGCADPAPQSGSFMAFGTEGSVAYALTFEALDINSNLLQSVSLPNVGGCAWTLASLTPSDSNIRKRVKFRIHYSGSTFGNDYLTTDDSYIWGGAVSFYYFTSGGSGGAIDIGFDNIQGGSSTITTGTFTSQAFSSGFSSATYQVPTFSYTANTTTPTFTLQTSTATTGTFSTLLTSTGTNGVGNQYARYVITFPTLGSSDSAFSAVTSVNVIARSTGSYYSVVHNAPNFTSWDTVGVNYQNNDGSHAFYVRAATNSFTVTSSTPAWTSVTAGGLVTASTGTFFQFRDDFALTAATQTPTLSDFTLNWFEGSASDQAYGLYFDNSIWFSVAYGVGVSTNNYIFRNDLINDGWTLYDFGAGGMLAQGNSLYFGDVTSGNVYRYGTQRSDNGSSIRSFWKSKDFTGSDPFIENEYKQLDTFTKRDANQTLTATYALNTSTTTTAYTINLSSTTESVIRNKKLLPSGKIGGTFNLQYGDTSASSQWEVFGFRVGYNPLTYRPTQ